MDSKINPPNSNRVDFSIPYTIKGKYQSDNTVGLFEVKGVKKYVWLIGALLSWLGWASKIQVTADKVVYVNKNSFFNHLAESWAQMNNASALMDAKATLKKIQVNDVYKKRAPTEENISNIFENFRQLRFYVAKKSEPYND